VHHAEFNVSTGAYCRGPGGRSLHPYTLKEKAGWIEILWQLDGSKHPSGDTTVMTSPHASRKEFLEKIRMLQNECEEKN